MFKISVSFFLLLVLLLSCNTESQKGSEQFFVKESDTTEVDILITLTDSLAVNPQAIQLWIQKGEICKERLDFECALDAGAHAYMLDSTNLKARELYAWTLMNKSNTQIADIEDAKRHFQYILSINSNDPVNLVNLANTYSLTGDFKTAFKYINDALKIDQYYREGYVLKGSIYKTIENYDLALSSYQTALQIDPNFFMGQLQTGWLLTEMENHRLAMEYYQNAVELRPTNINAIYGVAKSHQDLEEYDEALMNYKKISQIESGFYYAYFNQGYIKQYYQDDLDSAAYFYNKVFDYNPNYVPAWYQLGNVYFDLGRNTKAAEAYAEALNLDENYTPAREAAERLKNVRIK